LRWLPYGHDRLSLLLSFASDSKLRLGWMRCKVVHCKGCGVQELAGQKVKDGQM
jgi:hypothetical protein